MFQSYHRGPLAMQQLIGELARTKFCPSSSENICAPWAMHAAHDMHDGPRPCCEQESATMASKKGRVRDLFFWHPVQAVALGTHIWEG
mmetsp:Transcript_35493/g.63436  ORF Transcript_35493/g.63436 Transcript_35493/m.63436 type:complete len:88 (+) Transcript_35493:349-612(+)